MHEVFPASMTTYIWSTTTKVCALRQLVIDFYALLVHPEVKEGSIEQYHPDFVKDLALNGVKVSQQLINSVEPMEQRAGHYHELDKPCRKLIHGHASIDLKDGNGNAVTDQRALFATPNEYVNAVLPKPNYCTTVVKIQTEENVWSLVKKERWDDSFGTASTPRHLNVDLGTDDVGFRFRSRITARK